MTAPLPITERPVYHSVSARCKYAVYHTEFDLEYGGYRDTERCGWTTEGERANVKRQSHRHCRSHPGHEVRLTQVDTIAMVVKS